jgi:xanthine dehydrogenase accessory factor
VSELQDVLRAIEEGRAAGERMALATVVGVRGSTYRREGARLLVRETGKPVGTISGGCLEGDVRVTASEIMADGVPRLLHFDLTAEDEAVWGWGLGCNGVIDVFVEPAEGAIATAAAIRRAIEERRPLAAIVVTESTTGRPRPGARMLVHADGRPEGSLGDVELDSLALQDAMQALAEERSGVVELAPGVRTFVEALVPPIRLLVCGAGHDAIPLVRQAAGLGWSVTVIDDRDAFLKPHRFPEAERLVKTEPIDAASAAGVDERSHVVVMSHNFLRDKDYLRSFLGSRAPYIGMLGPAARLHKLLDALHAEGHDPDPADLLPVRGPAGLDLGGDGPDEVSWAIVAEILAVHHGRAGAPLRERTGPIHDRASAQAPAGTGAG